MDNKSTFDLCCNPDLLTKGGTQNGQCTCEVMAVDLGFPRNVRFLAMISGFGSLPQQRAAAAARRRQLWQRHNNGGDSDDDGDSGDKKTMMTRVTAANNDDGGHVDGGSNSCAAATDVAVATTAAATAAVFTPTAAHRSLPTARCRPPTAAAHEDKESMRFSFYSVESFSLCTCCRNQ